MTDHQNVYPITESLKVADIVGTGIASVSNLDTNKDGAIGTIEVLNAVQVNAFKVISNTPNLGELRKEATDYTEEEKDQIIEKIAQQNSFAKPKAKAIFERALRLAIDGIDLVIDIRRADADFEEVVELT